MSECQMHLNPKFLSLKQHRKHHETMFHNTAHLKRWNLIHLIGIEQGNLYKAIPSSTDKEWLFDFQEKYSLIIGFIFLHKNRIKLPAKEGAYAPNSCCFWNQTRSN
jgi:hypothetical protein